VRWAILALLPLACRWVLQAVCCGSGRRPDVLTRSRVEIGRHTVCNGQDKCAPRIAQVYYKTLSCSSQRTEKQGRKEGQRRGRRVPALPIQPVAFLTCRHSLSLHQTCLLTYRVPSDAIAFAPYQTIPPITHQENQLTTA